MEAKNYKKGALFSYSDYNISSSRHCGREREIETQNSVEHRDRY